MSVSTYVGVRTSHGRRHPVGRAEVGDAFGRQCRLGRLGEANGGDQVGDAGGRAVDRVSVAASHGENLGVEVLGASEEHLGRLVDRASQDVVVRGVVLIFLVGRAVEVRGRVLGRRKVGHSVVALVVGLGLEFLDRRRDDDRRLRGFGHQHAGGWLPRGLAACGRGRWRRLAGVQRLGERASCGRRAGGARAGGDRAQQSRA